MKDNDIDVVYNPETNLLCKPPETADIINRYFSEVGQKLDSLIENSTNPNTRAPKVRELIF